jgi:regulator of sirC expression with transglutaminase-like and TPR domain
VVPSTSRSQDGLFGISPKDVKLQRLRNELQQLFQQHLQIIQKDFQQTIKTMNDEEIIEKKAALKKQINDYKANAKMNQATKLLQEILKLYPKSPSAISARKMLRAPWGSTASGAASIGIE